MWHGLTVPHLCLLNSASLFDPVPTGDHATQQPDRASAHAAQMTQILGHKPNTFPSYATQCYAAWYGSCPGLKVLSPYSSEDARGLLKAAIRDPDPVVFLENELLYGESFPVSEAALDANFCLPIGKANIEREGQDVTITAFSKMVGYALKAADVLEKEGMSAEVKDMDEE